jgi:hypothetical protein
MATTADYDRLRQAFYRLGEAHITVQKAATLLRYGDTSDRLAVRAAQLAADAYKLADAVAERIGSDGEKVYQ